MPKFISLQSVVTEKLREQKNNMEAGVSFRSPVSNQLQIGRLKNTNFDEETGILRWGFSNWGVEKVTSEYKPREVK
jgi:hypothetical protein